MHFGCGFKGIRECSRASFGSYLWYLSFETHNEITMKKPIAHQRAINGDGNGVIT